jgi:hypothetical protein
MADDMTTQHGREPQARPAQAPPTYGFPKSEEALLPWARAVAQLEAARYYWLATTRPDGRPHVTPLWGVWVEGALYFDGLPTTRWGRNLAANPAAAIHLESGEDVLILEGVVEDLTTDADLGRRITDAWNAKYGRLAPDPAANGIVRLRPRTARAWSTATLEDGTSWRFSEEE